MSFILNNISAILDSGIYDNGELFIEIIETNEFQDRKPGKQPTGPWSSRTFTLQDFPPPSREGFGVTRLKLRLFQKLGWTGRWLSPGLRVSLKVPSRDKQPHSPACGEKLLVLKTHFGKSLNWRRSSQGLGLALAGLKGR